ncbi:MAG: hypothetical protein AAFR96_05775 [Planctomycetota bacterium]
MTTSERTINQVRNILGRLDRSIDEARDRRLRGPDDEPSAEAASASAAERAPHEDAPPSPRSPQLSRSAEAPPPPVGPRRSSSRAPSPFGRAKPLRRTGADD